MSEKKEKKKVVKKRRPKSKNYFTQATEDAIVRYNNSEDPELKSKIYGDEIHYPFFKLTENIIHTFKFYYTEVDKIEHLQHEIITFLLKKIHLFDPSRGAKNYKKRIDKAPVEDLYKDEKYSYNLEDGKGIEKLSYFMDRYIKYVEDNFEKFFPKGNDAQIADAILELFRKRESIEIFNKKALYIYIREIMATNGLEVKTPKITKIAGRLYNLFKDNYIFFLNTGYIEFQEE